MRGGKAAIPSIHQRRVLSLRVQLYQGKLRAEGLCVKCREPRDSTSTWYCGACMVIRRREERRRYHRKREQALLTSPPSN